MQMEHESSVHANRYQEFFIKYAKWWRRSSAVCAILTNVSSELIFVITQIFCFFPSFSFDFITVTVGYLLCTSVPRSTQKHSVFCHCPYWGVVQRFAAFECCSFFHQRGSCYFLQGLEGLLFHSPIYILLSLI